MAYIAPADLDKVLRRGKAGDDLGNKIAEAISLIEGVLDDLGESGVALSFNGGKDCTVLLHLFAAVLYERHNKVSASLQPAHTDISQLPHGSGPAGESSASAKACQDAPIASPPPLPACVNGSASASASAEPVANGQPATHHRAHQSAPYPVIRSVYFTSANPFPEMEAFVIESVNRYALDLYRFGGGMKAALSEYLSCLGGSEVRAILLGTRQGDPNGKVAVLAPTDPSWPQVLRVHPVLDWTYDDIWSFLRELDVEYCSLYDEGYTSLGSTTNTLPNPYLKTATGYEPAWKLRDGSQERAGRT
ncbi:FAD synthase [Vanrija pseudolonga]|uniref:FAD synthase n=1 Tax=Vanrija pseudolonga TaxID=143232 RepID=A0AAF1BJB4_9TREE|nr:FAD synthase [Vanrija pseudolonga]